MEKTCFKCGVTKPRTEFYGHPKMGEGLLGKCKECTKRDVKARADRLSLDPAWVESERKRGREKYHRLYRPEAPMPFWIADLSAAMKKKATCAVNNALRSGKLKRPKECSKCGELHHRISGHHEDYSKPLEVMWLCPKCHRARHAEKSETRSVQGHNAPIGQRPKERSVNVEPF